jgi:hypothetical protein
MFKEGRTNVKDYPRPGRPISATSKQDISTVKAIIDDDARHTMEEINDISGLRSRPQTPERNVHSGINVVYLF